MRKGSRVSLFCFPLIVPVISSPFSRDRGTGAAPRYLGSKLGWMLSVPNLGMSRKRCGEGEIYGVREAGWVHRRECGERHLKEKKPCATLS